MPSLDSVLGNKAGQIFLAGFEQDGQVATVDHMHAHCASLMDQLSKMSIELRRATGQIKRR